MPQRLQSPRLPPVALPSLVPAADDDSETLSPTPYDTSPSLATARYSSFSSSESLSNGITLKRTCPSPSPECVILEDQEAEYARKPWKRPILESRKRQKKEWQGRGRSPFKTPVTTVIDSIKQDTRELVTLERELGAARAQLQSTMAQRLQELNTLHAQQQRLASPVNITELAPETTLLQPTARDSGSPTHSTSPSRQILLGFPKATPAVAINTLPEGHMSEEVAGVLREILQCCKQGYIPGGLRVSSAQHSGSTRVMADVGHSNDSKMQINGHRWMTGLGIRRTNILRWREIAYGARSVRSSRKHVNVKQRARMRTAGRWRLFKGYFVGELGQVHLLRAWRICKCLRIYLVDNPAADLISPKTVASNRPRFLARLSQW